MTFFQNLDFTLFISQDLSKLPGRLASSNSGTSEPSAAQGLVSQVPLKVSGP